jgi:hypothetical protein
MEILKKSFAEPALPNSKLQRLIDGYGASMCLSAAAQPANGRLRKRWRSRKGFGIL